MKAYKLTTCKDYMAFLRMFRDAPDNLMEMGGFADEYKVPDECKDKVKKVIENRKEKKIDEANCNYCLHGFMCYSWCL